MALTDKNLRLTTDQLATTTNSATDVVGLGVVASIGVGTPLFARIAVTTDGASTGSIVFRIMGYTSGAKAGGVALIQSRSYDADTELLAGDAVGGGNGTIIMLEVPALPRSKMSADAADPDLAFLGVDWVVTGTITGLTVTVDFVTGYDDGKAGADYYPANAFPTYTVS